MTLDPDTEALLRQIMRDHGVSFKQALNDAIRRGTAPNPKQSFTTRTKPLGTTEVNIDRALQLSASLEDEELVRRMRVGT